MLKSIAAAKQEKGNYTEKDAIETLRAELEKGINSLKAGRVYTMEEVWKEIDTI